MLNKGCALLPTLLTTWSIIKVCTYLDDTRLLSSTLSTKSPRPFWHQFIPLLSADKDQTSMELNAEINSTSPRSRVGSGEDEHIPHTKCENNRKAWRFPAVPFRSVPGRSSWASPVSFLPPVRWAHLRTHDPCCDVMWGSIGDASRALLAADRKLPLAETYWNWLNVCSLASAFSINKSRGTRYGTELRVALREMRAHYWSIDGWSVRIRAGRGGGCGDR